MSRAYAQTPEGRAARMRARAKWLAKRKAEHTNPQFNPEPLAHVITNWRSQ